MNKKVKWGIIIFIGAGLIGWGIYSQLPKENKELAAADKVMSSNRNGKKALNVNAKIIKPQLLKDEIKISGSLLPDEEVDLSFETSGKIIEINFEEGSQVKKGQLLAKVNDRPLQAQLQRLVAQLKLAEDRVFRQNALLERDAVSKEAYEQVKTELAKHLGKSRHCQIAELAALIAFEGRIPAAESENRLLMQKYQLLLAELFHIEEIHTEEEARSVFSTVKMYNDATGEAEPEDTVKGLLIQQSCCKRAYIRGAFLAGGSISDPNKSYHFEIVCRSIPQAEQLRDVINSFDMDAKIVARKKYQVVYLKEGSQIVDILNIMEAHVALMNLENVRILKEMRNSVNRKVNCETANISKTVNAAVKQLADIEYIRETAGLSYLPENLKEMALLRLEYPDAPLAELGTYLNPPVGKSGVNHRLRRISEMADSLRQQTV